MGPMAHHEQLKSASRLPKSPNYFRVAPCAAAACAHSPHISDGPVVTVIDVKSDRNLVVSSTTDRILLGYLQFCGTPIQEHRAFLRHWSVRSIPRLVVLYVWR